MKEWAWLGGSVGGAGAMIVWLHSVGALPADFLYWAIVVALALILSYIISWGTTEAMKHLFIPRPWHSEENRRKIYAHAMFWAFAPATSAAAGIGLTHEVPIWYWFIAPWIAMVPTVSSSKLWSFVFERLLPKVKRINRGGKEYTVPEDFPTDHESGDHAIMAPKDRE